MFRTMVAAFAAVLLVTGAADAGVTKGRINETGQTTGFGPGSDGDLERGLTRIFNDLGNGVVKDARTGLTWEKKSDDGSLHDVDATYNFEDAIGVFIAGLNTANYGGHNDWRLPNRFELETLVDLGQQNPAIDGGLFNTLCLPACTVATCSCTGLSAGYWTSTTVVATPNYAWVVYFNLGGNGFDLKTNTDYVRAVRGGL